MIIIYCIIMFDLIRRLLYPDTIMNMKQSHRQYYALHRASLEQLKADAMAAMGIQRSAYKMFYDCACGSTKLQCKNLEFHFMTKKHRKACGEVPSLTLLP
jgi:hypothetical protein|nr:MAG: hypothetical protein [Lake Baikal virophage 2]